MSPPYDQDSGGAEGLAGAESSARGLATFLEGVRADVGGISGRFSSLARSVRMLVMASSSKLS